MVGLVFLGIGAAVMYGFLSFQQRSWYSFSADASDWMQTQRLKNPPKVTAICGGDSLPDGYVEADLGDVDEERVRQIFADAVTEFDLKQQEEPADGGFYGIGRWRGFEIEGYLGQPEGEETYTLGFSFDPRLCLSA